MGEDLACFSLLGSLNCFSVAGGRLLNLLYGYEIYHISIHHALRGVLLSCVIGKLCNNENTGAMAFVYIELFEHCLQLKY